MTYDRNRDPLYTNPDENADKEARHQRDDNSAPTKGDPDAGSLDLDGDGLIGNTGGFYGGTSYLGSNYGADWNEEGRSERGEGNYGAAGNSDPSDDTDRSEGRTPRRESSGDNTSL